MTAQRLAGNHLNLLLYSRKVWRWQMLFSACLSLNSWNQSIITKTSAHAHTRKIQSLYWGKTGSQRHQTVSGSLALLYFGFQMYSFIVFLSWEEKGRWREETKWYRMGIPSINLSRLDSTLSWLTGPQDWRVCPPARLSAPQVWLAQARTGYAGWVSGLAGSTSREAGE